MPDTNSSVTVEKAKAIKFACPSLDVVVVGKWIWVTGETFPLRSQLVALGLRWAKEKSKWYWKPAGHFFKGPPQAYQAIAEKYGELRVQPVRG